MQNTHTANTPKVTDRIQIVYPPAMKLFMSELCEACGTSFDEYNQNSLDMLEGEITDTFSESPFPGMLSHIAETEGMEAATDRKVREVIERHRGKFALAE